MDNERQSSKTLDDILDILFNQDRPKIKILATHKYPDDDALLCLWLAKNFISNTTDAQIVFINSGERIPGTENDPSVLHFDTGLGQYDQHGKGFGRTCSAKLLAQKIGLPENGGIKPLVDLATAADNIEPLPFRDVHFLITGYPHQFRDPETKETDWDKVRERVFEIFDILYGQEQQRFESRKELKDFGRRIALPNGIKVTTILWHPNCREAAFEEGADVVIWTQHKKRKFYTCIQVSRRCNIRLDNVAAALRGQEYLLRSIKVTSDLHAVHTTYDGDPWFLYDNKRLILNGSRTHELAEDEFTRLDPDRIIGITQRTLSAIPRNMISRRRD